MKTFWKFTLVALMGLTSAVASAQALKTLKIATGGPKGTYSQMFKELSQMCTTEVPMVEVNTSGSIENIELLTGNQINGAWTQTDVLHFLARTQEMGNVKTLMAMHPEEVHLVVKANSGIKVGGVMGIGSKEVTFPDITALAGYKVGASGGSETTAQVIRLQSEIPYSVVRMNNTTEVLKAVFDGSVQAGLLVGGSPLGDVANLGPEFRLLPIPESVAAKLKGVYRATRVSYPKMNAAGVPTVSTDALFVTREYTTPAMRNTLSKFRACAMEKLSELKETTGTHKKWQAVDPANKGKWVWYDLP